MTTVLPSLLPGRRTPLAANSLARTEKPNLPQSPPIIPKPSTGANSPAQPSLASQPKRKPGDCFVSPGKEPTTSSVQIRRLRGEPTEPPKQTLNGRNQPLNGVFPFASDGAGFRLPIWDCFAFHHFSSLFRDFQQGGNRQTTVL